MWRDEAKCKDDFNGSLSVVVALMERAKVKSLILKVSKDWNNAKACHWYLGFWVVRRWYEHPYVMQLSWKKYIVTLDLNISMLWEIKVTLTKGFEPKVRSPQALSLATKSLTH